MAERISGRFFLEESSHLVDQLERMVSRYEGACPKADVLFSIGRAVGEARQTLVAAEMSGGYSADGLEQLRNRYHDATRRGFAMVDVCLRR